MQAGTSVVELSSDPSVLVEAAPTGAPLRIPRWVILAWVVPAALAAVQAIVFYWAVPRTRGGQPDGISVKEWLLVATDFARWMTWALLTPLIFWLARRLPIRRVFDLPRIFIHLLIALLFCSATEAIWFIVRFPLLMSDVSSALVRPFGSGAFSQLLSRALVAGCICYAAIATATAAVDSQRRLRARELRQTILEGQLAQAQVQAMKMQLHPHFLFNSLHAINVLIREEPNLASNMLTRLGDLLRITLTRTERMEVTLAEELSLLRVYFEIESIRFKDRLSIRYEVEPSALSMLVPDLLLQPLAENAITHGVARTRGPSCIVVRAEVAGDRLIIEIEDNGAGLAQSERVQEHIGLGATRRRLTALYGPAASLYLSEAQTAGCTVRIEMPSRVSDTWASPAREQVTA